MKFWNWIGVLYVKQLQLAECPFFLLQKSLHPTDLARDNRVDDSAAVAHHEEPLGFGEDFGHVDAGL